MVTSSTSIPFAEANNIIDVVMQLANVWSKKLGADWEPYPYRLKCWAYRCCIQKVPFLWYRPDMPRKIPVSDFCSEGQIPICSLS